MNELTTKRQGYDLKLILYHEIIHGKYLIINHVHSYYS